MNDIIIFFTAPYEFSSSFDILLEATAAILGTLSVWYAKKEKVLLYPAGIISALLFVIICYRFVLYGDLIMNIYFAIMSIYGWYMWTRVVGGKQISISRSNSKNKLIASGVFIFTIIFISTIYIQFNVIDSSLGFGNTIDLIIKSLRSNQLSELALITPYIDTFTTGLFFTAIYLMANKKIEHWIFWIVANSISIPLYLIKGLGFTSIQYIIFLVIAIQGYSLWNKTLKARKSNKVLINNK